MFQILSFNRNTKLDIYVKSNTGKTLSVKVDPTWDIKHVKELVAPQLGLNPDEVKIIFAGKELNNAVTVKECDLGQLSILHAIKTSPMKYSDNCSLQDLQDKENYNTNNEQQQDLSKTVFFVHCSQCKKFCKGKLRVRCSHCKGGAFTVNRDPECWDDVLKPKKITGHCENYEINECLNNSSSNGPLFAEFYFKCGEHISGGEKDFAVPLSLIKNNTLQVPCLACTDICDTVLVFPCESKHVICVECFAQYCRSRLLERQFMHNSIIGYTLTCPAGCEDSFVEEVHHFKLMSKDEYDRYQRFATEEYVLESGGVFCPQPNCGMGFIVEDDVRKITCEKGCGYVFCRDCLQSYHLGDCSPEKVIAKVDEEGKYSIDPMKALRARWDEASRLKIKESTKPCPFCLTPTEKNGGCMHMVCTRPRCRMHWCWLCQDIWSNDCMQTHWFH